VGGGYCQYQGNTERDWTDHGVYNVVFRLRGDYVTALCIPPPGHGLEKNLNAFQKIVLNIASPYY
jgi:hypothetical protein